MCGICGKITYDQTPVTDEEVRRMCDQLTHRGPDDQGIYCRCIKDPAGKDLSAGLGHTRLSIIDLSPSGHQPMSNEDKTVWIVFNGEIYNYKSLRDELLSKGHQFKSQSDTEVILHLYEEKGTDAVLDLNGMFAFALWDERAARLWLCRDRVGIKPMIYFWDGQNLAFASEIKALLKLPEIGLSMDGEALELYLAFNYIPAPYTIYKEIRKLEPGHSLILEKGRITKCRYWKLAGQMQKRSEPPLQGLQIAQYRQKLLDAMTDAVTSQMIADVPLGAFLSGGIDSSIVVALMAMNSDRPVKTFSIGFKDSALFDETRYSREVAERYRTDHHEFKLAGHDMLDIFPQVLSTFDEPFADSSAIPTFIVSMHTRRHVKVALSGDGGDELFAGYRSYLGEYWHDSYMKFPAFIRRGIEKITHEFPDSRDIKWMEFVRRLKKFVHSVKGDYPKRLLALKTVFPDQLRRNLFSSFKEGADAKFQKDIALERVKQFIHQFSGDRINTMLYTDFADSLPGDMLNKVDWMSMQHGLEVRVPFLDHKVAELAFEIPGDLKIKGLTTKYILKQAFEHLLPKSLIHRPKAGFEIPISRWLKTDLHFLITDYLSEKRIKAQGIFNPLIINQLISDFRSNRTDTSWMLWNLIVFQYWHETCMN